MTPKHKAAALLALGAGLGIAIWVLSPWLTGRTEPWDADAPIWPLSWLVVAACGGLTGRVRGVCLPLGYALGQLGVTLRSAFVGEFGVLGWMFIVGYAIVAVAITLAMVGIAALVRSRMSTHGSHASRRP